MNDKREQFSGIYDQYIEKIYRFVYIKVNSQEIAEDITSKVFLKGWETYQKTQETVKNPGAFLYQIARNSVIDHYREKGRTKIVSTEYVPQIIDNKAGLQEKAMINSDFETVKTAIQGLKKDYQDIIIWHYLDGIEVPEIAEIMQKPAGTIRVMIHRGLRELKKGLGSKEA
ncbi:MAG: RNA polymerase sigma factor [Patescibacteria group bacterium]